MEIRMICKKGQVDMIMIKDIEDRFVDTNDMVAACIEKLVDYLDVGDENRRTFKVECDLYGVDEGE